MALSNETKLSLGIKQSFALVAAMVKARPCLKIDFQRFKSICATMVPCSILIWIAATFPCVMKKS